MLRHFVYKDRLLIQSGSSGFVLVHRCSWSRMGDPWKDSLLDALGGDPQAVVVGRPKARRQPGRRQPAAAAPAPIVPAAGPVLRRPASHQPETVPAPEWWGASASGGILILRDLQSPFGWDAPAAGICKSPKRGCPLRWDLQILEEGDVPSAGICKS